MVADELVYAHATITDEPVEAHALAAELAQLFHGGVRHDDDVIASLDERGHPNDRGAEAVELRVGILHDEALLVQRPQQPVCRRHGQAHRAAQLGQRERGVSRRKRLEDLKGTMHRLGAAGRAAVGPFGLLGGRHAGRISVPHVGPAILIVESGPNHAVKDGYSADAGPTHRRVRCTPRRPWRSGGWRRSRPATCSCLHAHRRAADRGND